MLISKYLGHVDEVLFPDKVRINIEYLDNWSFWNDIKIIVYTVLGKDL